MEILMKVCICIDEEVFVRGMPMKWPIKLAVIAV